PPPPPPPPAPRTPPRRTASAQKPADRPPPTGPPRRDTPLVAVAAGQRHVSCVGATTRAASCEPTCPVAATDTRGSRRTRPLPPLRLPNTPPPTTKPPHAWRLASGTIHASARRHEPAAAGPRVRSVPPPPAAVDRPPAPAPPAAEHAATVERSPAWVRLVGILTAWRGGCRGDASPLFRAWRGWPSLRPRACRASRVGVRTFSCGLECRRACRLSAESWRPWAWRRRPRGPGPPWRAPRLARSARAS